MKEVVLKCNSNIFGFQLKGGSKLYIEPIVGETNQSLIYQTTDDNGKPTHDVIRINFNLFDRSMEDFIKEATRINGLFDEIEKEGGQLPLYELEITNQNKEAPELVTLFGMNRYLLTPNFNSGANIKVKALHPDISYLEYLQRSASQPFIIDFICLESENVNQVTQLITYTTMDANGNLAQKPIITQSYRGAKDENPNVLMISHKMSIDGNSHLQFDILKDTKLKVKIYCKRNSYIDSTTLSILNGVLSCQIQQGIDFVSVENIKKFIGNNFDDYFYKDTVERNLTSLFEKGFIDFKDGLYGYKFRILKVDGTIAKELSLTQVLKHSEYNINQN